jgi:hypothetical protein
MWATTNSEPPGPIIMIGQSETQSSSEVIFIALFCAGAQRCCNSYQPLQTLHLCWAKTIFLSQSAFFDFSWPNFTVRNHIWSTPGDALILLAMCWQSVHSSTVQSQGRYHWIKVQSLYASLPTAGPKFSLWKTSLLGEGTSCTAKISIGLLCITND